MAALVGGRTRLHEVLEKMYEVLPMIILIGGLVLAVLINNPIIMIWAAIISVAVVILLIILYLNS